MYDEGCHQQSIATCLHLSCKHVWHILQAFNRDGFAALEDQRSRPADHPENQRSLPFFMIEPQSPRSLPRSRLSRWRRPTMWSK